MTDPDRPDRPRAGPVLIDLDGATPAPGPETAPPVPELTGPTRPTALQTAAVLAARGPSRLAKWFWGLLGAILSFAVSWAAWTWVTGLLATYPLVGLFASVLFGAFLLVLLAIAVKEAAAFHRLSRLDDLQRQAAEVYAAADLAGARALVKRLVTLYRARPDTEWGRSRLAEREADILDADGLLALAEADLLGPLDTAAMREVEAAARQVATVTAIVPLALADVFTALTSNLRMIRRIAEIYGGRSGTLGAWRLTRAVLAHLVATGAVAVGDDLIHSVAGGSLLSRLSRRFGEGVVNGALTARVGVAAIEVCRPLPFRARPRPSVTALLRRALTGLFGQAEE